MTFDTASPGAHRAVSVPSTFFATLRGALQGDPGQPTIGVDAIRDAGYAAGRALHDDFAGWLMEQGERSPGDLADDRFGVLVEAFFHLHGWGRVEIAELSDAVFAIDAFDWVEDGRTGGGCLVSTGLFAGFFGCIAQAPLAVLEVDVGVTPGHCRFLIGSVDVMHELWEAMGRGERYDDVAPAL